MNCGCTTPEPCPPNPASPQAVSSQLLFLMTSLFGELSYTYVNCRVVWDVPCNLLLENPLFPRTEGEGLLCYLLRIYGNGFVIAVTAPTTTTDFSMFPENTPPATGFFQAADDLNLYTLKGGDTEWFVTPR